MKYQFFSEPTPHIYFEELVDPEIYQKAKFPDIPRRRMGRIGRDLYEGEAGYDEIIGGEGWKEIHQQFTSEEFVKFVLSLFSEEMKKNNCLVKAEDCYLSPYVEARSKVATLKSLDSSSSPEALFTRFDFQAADSKYSEYVHLDHKRRIVGGLLFFCDAQEEKMKGGSFALYIDKHFQNDRRCYTPIRAKEIPVKHNTGVLFLNCNKGFHGPTTIESIDGLRKWIYLSISSQIDVWPVDTSMSLSKVNAIARRGFREFRENLKSAKKRS